MLERIGHEFRMRNERLTKAEVLGWLEELERLEREVEKKAERRGRGFCIGRGYEGRCV